MTALVTPRLIQALQTARRRHGLDDPAYRELLATVGVSSTKELTSAQAANLLDRLNGSDRRPAPARQPHLTLSGKFAPKLRALWLSAWNLGLTREHDDAAIIAFVRRQTGLSHDRFLFDAEEAAKVIEALKDWIARDGGVTWPSATRTNVAKASQAGVPFHVLLKHAVVAAQCAKLGLSLPPLFTAEDLDALQAELGRRLRSRRP
jgi:hypothetical protein